MSLPLLEQHLLCAVSYLLNVTYLAPEKTEDTLLVLT